MGRRKIQIKPIQHERNRTVTFLKRKQGLFKKAYELSVLCSIDIAVIIFDKPAGQPKCYEFSSGNVNEIVNRHVRFDGERDTKGTADFANGGANGRKDDDDDEEEDDYRAGYGMNYMRGPHAPVMPDYGMHHPPMPGHPSLPGYPRMMDDRNGAGAPVVPDRQRNRAGTAASYRPYPDPHRRDMPSSYGGYPPSNPYPPGPASRGPMNGSPLMPANSLVPPHGSTPPLGQHPHESYTSHPASVLSGPPPPLPASSTASPYQQHSADLQSPGSLPNPMSWSGTHSIHHSPALTHNSLVHSPPSSISGISSTATSDAGWSNVGGPSFYPDNTTGGHSPSGSPHLDAGNSPVGPVLPV